MANSNNVSPIPKDARSITPYLTVKDAKKAIEFYKKAFGATESHVLEMPDGRIGHAQLKFGDSNIMLADMCPEMGGKDPNALGGSPVMLHFYTEKVDDVFKQAVKAGATVKQEVKDQFYGDRSGCLQDPFGHIWYVATHVEDVSDDEIKRRAAEWAKKTQAEGKKSAA